MASRDCSICCEKFSSKVRVKVECNYCDLECCRQCVQKYLTETTTDPHCMQCKNAWNREFVDLACTKTFRNHQLKSHRENLLFEREKCLLPDAQVILAHRKECEKKITEYSDRIKALSDEMYALHIEIDNVRRQSSREPTEKRKFVRKCPVTDCRGFLSTQWKCEVCDNKICHECNEIKEDTHECKPENIETMKLINKDTKPCPNCGTMIFKISGCSQMWCPDCHTAFDWNTLRIERGVIHNPHFYEFQRLGGVARRNPGDIPCGGVPGVNELYLACNLHYGRYASTRIPVESKMVFDFCQLVNHVEHVEMLRAPVENNLELRIRYLSNTLGENEYKHILQKNEKSREKIRDINNILTMLTQTGADLLRQFVNKEITLEQIKDVIANLLKYTNSTLQVVSDRYSCVVPQVNEDTLAVYRRRGNAEARRNGEYDI